MKKDEHQGIIFNKLILEKVNFEIDPDYAFGKDPLEVRMSGNVNRFFSDDKKHLKVTLHINVDLAGANPAPMKIYTVMAGYFSLMDGKDSKSLVEFAEIHAPTMIFPFIRETIANLTMRTDFPPLLLPPANMWALMGKKNKGSEKTVKKGPAKKAAKN